MLNNILEIRDGGKASDRRGIKKEKQAGWRKEDEKKRNEFGDALKSLPRGK
jgi:hypothetical protein